MEIVFHFLDHIINNDHSCLALIELASLLLLKETITCVSTTIVSIYPLTGQKGHRPLISEKMVEITLVPVSMTESL